MDVAQALSLLSLQGNPTQEQVSQAHEKKLLQVQSLLEKAPTDGLKDKYRKIMVQLEEAQQVLSNSQAGSSSRADEAGSPRSARDDSGFGSPLSQTKLADLPGANPFQAHFEGGSAGANVQIETGQTLAGRYEIKELIAAGGMGAVYRAHDTNRNEDIAVKVMLPHLMQHERARERFLDEAKLSSQLSHPNIVNVYDVQQDGDLCFLTMELLEGQDLRQMMENRKLARQHFSLEEVLDILQPVCAALDHAHEVTVHRDIKPENIYLTEHGKYKLMDFGIARLMSTSQRTQTGAASGTAYYMAPEQLKGQSDIDGRADQYALAVLAYELLSGDVPAGAVEPLHTVVKGIGKKASAAVQKALSPKPENRFDSLAEFTAALQGGGSALSLPSFDLSKLAIPAVILIALLMVGGIYQSGMVDLGALFMSKAELAQRKAASAKLAGEIKNIQKRLESGRRSLDSDVRDAKRNNSRNLKALQHWQQLTEDSIFEGDALTEQEGQLAMAETLLRGQSFDQAEIIFQQVKAGYQTLYQEFQTSEKSYALGFRVRVPAALEDLDEMAVQLGVDLKKIALGVEDENYNFKVLVEGEAPSNRKISNLMRNINDHEMFYSPNLLEVKATGRGAGTDFSLEVGVGFRMIEPAAPDNKFNKLTSNRAVAEREPQTKPVAKLNNRENEYLESIDIEKIYFVGTLLREGTLFALLNIPSRGQVHRAVEGNYIGLNSGLITQITRKTVTVTETFFSGDDVLKKDMVLKISE